MTDIHVVIASSKLTYLKIVKKKHPKKEEKKLKTKETSHLFVLFKKSLCSVFNGVKLLFSNHYPRNNKSFVKLFDVLKF